MGTKIFHQIKKWSFLVPLTTLFMLLSVMSYAQETQTVYNPVVTTDKLDYAPGETVYIEGSGFWPGEIVVLLIEHIEPNLPDPWHTHDAWEVDVDENGNFYSSWYVGEEELGTTLYLTAVGMVSGLEASTIFTDANVRFKTSGLPGGLNVTVTYSGTAPGQGNNPGGPVDGTITFSTSSPGQSNAIALVGDLTFSFSPESFTVGSNEYILSGTTPTSPATDIPSNGNYDITGNYSLQSGAEGSIASVSIGSQSSSVIYGSTSTVNYDVTAVRASNGTVDGTYSVSGLPGGVTAAFNPASFTSAGGNAFSGSTLSLTVLDNINVGSYPFTVTLTAGDAGSASTEGILVVEKADQTITWATPANIVYGTTLSAAQLNATVAVPGTEAHGAITYDPDFGTELDAGTHTLTVNVAGSDNYNAASTTVQLVVEKADQTITWATPANIVYGTTLSAAQLNATVAVPGTEAHGAITYDPDFGTELDAGTHTLTVNVAGSDNYNEATASVTLIVDKANLSIIVNDASKYCGQVNPTFTVSYDGFVNDEDESVLGGTLVFTTDADEYSTGASYSVTPSGLTSGNYAITFENGTLTILPVSIDASASSNPVALGTDATLSATVVNELLAPVEGVLVTFTLTYYDELGDKNTLTSVTGYTEANGIVTIPDFEVPDITTVYKVTAVAGGGCSEDVAYLPVYDPSAGFVTGGGWIMSPAGAYKADESLTGKANFGFNAKYKKGKSDVEGNTEFHFHAAGMKFKSDFHESGSLVISGGKATYRGEGTINGTGSYKFTLVAFDGDWNNGTDPDRFRIKIWGNNGIVYDNGLGTDDNSNDATILGDNGRGGGSIVIHEVKAAPGRNKSAEIATAIEPEVHQPMFNVYPNPFTDRLRIEFVPEETTHGRIDLFDMTGRLVKTIFDQPVSAGEHYNAEFVPGSEVTSFYIYRLSLGDAVRNGRVIYRK